MPKYKGVEIDTKPNDSMVSNARRGLEWREEFGRGGTEVGVARARDILNRVNLSFDTVKRMRSYFARHEVDKQAEGFSSGEEGFPSAGRIAWELWGGDSGKAFADRIVERLNSIDERSAPELQTGLEEEVMQNQERAKPDELSVGDYVSWNSSGGRARGEIERIVTEGELKVPDTDFSIDATPEDPAALIRIYTDGESTDTLVGHKFSTLTKIDPIEPEDIEMNDERAASVEVTHRAMKLEAKTIDEETRRVRIAISSEEPVPRSFGLEVLEHSQEAINLSFLASGRAPLLLDHDPEKQIGVIESVELDSSARRLRATVRFGKGALAREAFDDVMDGIRTNISVGYAITKLERKDKDTYVARSWMPMEASLVSIPADVTVGVGRSSDTSTNQPVVTFVKEDTKMSEVDIDAVRAESAQNAQRNASQILALGKRHNMLDAAESAIASGKGLDEFRGMVLDKIGSGRALEDQSIGMERKEVKRYSLLRAINALANPTDVRAQKAAAFEFECSRAAAAQYGTTAQGLMIPVDVLRNWDLAKRTLNSSDDSSLFTDDFRGGDFIDVLRNASSVMQAGARMLSGLSGDVKIPKKLTAAAASWISTEGGDTSSSEMTVGSVSMVPRTLGAFTDATRQLLIQSSLDVEALMRDDLATALALAIDKAALEGSGSSGQPTGILLTSGVNKPTAFAAAIPTFAEVVEMETAVATDNALMGNLAYILPAAMYGGLKTKEKATNTAQFVVEPGGTINGYRGIVSNQATDGNLYFGNFADLLVGFFGGLDITVDPYTNSRSGTVRIVALQSCDVAVRHAVSFAYNNDTV